MAIFVGKLWETECWGENIDFPRSLIAKIVWSKADFGYDGWLETRLPFRVRICMMKIPYSRPTSLSDPFHDFTPEWLEQLLATSDDNLKWNDFVSLLGPFMPAGTYAESVYFLPLAYRYLDGGEHALDVTTSVCWFISEYAERLAKDGLLDECRAEMRVLLLGWVSDFTVKHFDRDDRTRMGWGLICKDIVFNCETLCQTLEDLFRFVRHMDLADGFIMELALSEKPVSGAWFLELARAHVENDVYPPPAHEASESLLTDGRLLAEKAVIVRKHIAPVTASPTYWNDVFSKLGLEPSH
jgi:hypothetical protein